MNISIVKEKMETNNYIGKRLRLERKRLLYTQSEFADVAGVTRQTQSKYEQGLRAPDAHYLHKIAVVGVNLEFLITGSTSRQGTGEGPLLDNPGQAVTASTTVGNSQPLTSDEQQYLAWYRQLNADDRGLLATLLRRLVESGNPGAGN